MYSLNKALNATKQTYTKVSDYEIFCKYIPGFKINTLIKSPLREDSHPSFSTYKTNNSIRFRDFSTGDSGNAIEFVKRLFKLSTVQEAYNHVSKDFKGFTVDNSYINLTEKKHINIVRQPFKKADLDFWDKYGISKDTLVRYDVFSIKNYLVNGEVKGIYTVDNPMYAYKVYDKFKIYRPLSNKSYKWRQNLTNWDLQGFAQLPNEGDTLIITKSLKDVMVLSELGYNAVAPSSESVMIPPEVISNLSKRFKKIYIFYDRDKAGMKTTRELSKKYQLDFFFINKIYNVKDISDFVKMYGSEKAKEFMDVKTKENTRQESATS